MGVGENAALEFVTPKYTDCDQEELLILTIWQISNKIRPHHQPYILLS